MVSHPETGSDSSIGSDQDRGRDKNASWIIRAAEMSIFPLWNSSTTTAIRRVYRWHHMRHCMGGHADHRYVGPRWEKAPSLVLI